METMTPNAIYLDLRANLADIVQQYAGRDDTDVTVRALMRCFNASIAPRNMQDAPPGDGWVLGLIDNCGFGTSAPVWRAVTRCDDGWEDERGVLQSPSAWVGLPEPQPEPTGWKPAEGSVWFGAARGLNWEWKGWMVHVTRPDGEHDATRDPFYLNDPLEARKVAVEQGLRLGLPIVEGAMEHTAEILPFRQPDKSL